MLKTKKEQSAFKPGQSECSVSGFWLGSIAALMVIITPDCAYAALPPVAITATTDNVAASSNDSSGADMQPKDLNSVQTVTVQAQHYNNAVGTSDAASQGVILGELLQDRPLLRPGEVLEAIPGMVVTQHSGDGKANQYFLRGYNLDHGTDFASSVDDVPVNMPTSAHGQGYTDLNFLIPELVDHIDYRKGTYFAENGDFSSAGSAAIQYRNSLERNFLDLTVGDNGYRRAVLGGSTPVGNATNPSTGGTPVLLGGLELLEENGPWTPPENARKVNFFGRLSDGTRASGWSVDTVLYDSHWHAVDQVPLALIEAGQLGRYSAVNPTDGGNTGRLSLSGEWHDRDQDGYSKISAFAEHYRLQLWTDFTYYELRPDTGDQFEQVEDRNMFGTKAVQGWNHSLFGHVSVTEVGVQLRHDQIHVGLLDTEGRIPFATVSDNLVGETEAGLYVQNTTDWATWLRSVVGLRSDHIWMDMTSLNIPANSGSASGNKLSPKLALVFGPWYRTEFFLDAGRGFHSNDARGVIDRVDPTTGLPAPAVPVLAGSVGKEIGLRTEAIPGLQTSLALWSLNSDSELVYNQDSDIGSTSPNGASKRDGLEWNNHLVLNNWLLLDADVAWTHARFAQMNDNGATGNYIPNAVGRVASFGLVVTHLGPWSGGLNTRYIGSYPLSQDAGLTAPSAIVTNLRIQRDITPNLTLSFNVLNLFNRDYFDIAYAQSYQVAPTVPAVANGITVHPGEPRELRMNLKYQF